jgi:single-strand DNA-binding protein
MIYIEGKIRTRSYEKEGVTRYITEVIADNMTMLSTKGSAGSSSGNTYAPAEVSAADGFRASATVDSTTDDLPF